MMSLQSTTSLRQTSFVNLADHHIIDYFDKVDFIEKVKARKIAKPEAISTKRLLRHHGAQRPLHDGK